MEEPSAVSRPVSGGSGLTDPERMFLGDLAVANTMRALGICQDDARELLGDYAEQDRVTICGDRYLVGLFVDDTYSPSPSGPGSAASSTRVRTSTPGVVLSPVSLPDN
jgi:hypothetical protein